MSATSTTSPVGRGSPVSWAFLGWLLVADQMLLPMFHAGGAPYKLSFLLCGLWLIDTLARGERDPWLARQYSRFVLAMAVVVGCALLGELWLAANYPVSDYGQTVRSVLIYGLVTLSFGIGLSAGGRFRFEWLVPILLVALALNFATIFLRASLPPWLIDMYYSEQQVAALADKGVTDTRALLEMVRPRGLFSNPNVSAHMVNVIALFIYLGLRNGRMQPPRPLVSLLVIALPLLLSTMLASRGEFLVASLLAFLNFRLIFRRSSARARASLAVTAIVVPLLGAVALARVVDVTSLVENWDRVMTVLDAVSEPSQMSSDEQELSGVSRPLLTFHRMWVRFEFSPIFGTGFSATDGPPFAAGTEFFHNDWFRVIATSGLLGLAAMLWILWEFCRPYGLVALVPFVLPAMVNSFMLVIPAFMFYFFMIGVLNAGGRPQPTSPNSA
jgi:hypothetical protein